MYFSPLLITTLIVEPLRYFFSQFPKTEDGLFWDKDDKVTTIEIGTTNDFHKTSIQMKPRILVDRGGYTINKTGLSDNLAESKGIKQLYGKSERINMVFVSGVAEITIEARQEGTCELITDMVTHLIAGAKPFICNEMGFKEFGLPMSVGPCQVDKEDAEKFKVTLQIPYMCEDHWMVKFDAIKFKELFLELQVENLPPRVVSSLGTPST